MTSCNGNCCVLEHGVLKMSIGGGGVIVCGGVVAVFVVCGGVDVERYLPMTDVMPSKLQFEHAR